MADEIQKVKETTTQAGNTVQKTTEVSDPATTIAKDEHGQNVAARVIWYLAGVLLVLLAFRFVLTLLGANPANAFADFIYNASHPFVAPFFGLFGYDLKYGVSKFELYTLVAMAVYALIAFGLVRLVTITRR